MSFDSLFSLAASVPIPESPHELYNIQERSGRGRGCFAKDHLTRSTHILTCVEPIAHVIERRYKKEVCAWCFYYDRGRTLRLTLSSTCPSSPQQSLNIAWFCSDDCSSLWSSQNSAMAMESIAELDLFSRVRSKDLPKAEDDEFPLRGASPDEIQQEWSDAETLARLIRDSRTSESPNKAQKRVLRETRASLQGRRKIDLDAAYFFLSAIIKRSQATQWRSLQAVTSSLLMYQRPITGYSVLKIHIYAYKLLLCTLPLELLSFCDGTTILSIAMRDATNSFGIWSTDSDECMGYGVWIVASFFNHSCDPNVKKSLQGRCWTFECASEVGAGEELCISYLGEEQGRLPSVEERRTRLLDAWGFLCLCARCVRESAPPT